jgi:hypothetical protein
MSSALAWFNPFLLWTDVAGRTAKMMFDASGVIAQRTSRMAAHGANPTAADRAEMKLMGSEKVAAGGEAARAMLLRMGAVQAQWGALAFSQMLRSGQAMGALAVSCNPAQFAARQRRVIDVAMQNGNEAAAKASSTTARLTRSAIKPVHAVVKKNARRLAAKR